MSINMSKIAQSRFSRRNLNDRIASANVEFNYSTEKKSSVEFSVERPKTAYNTCVYRSFRKNKKILLKFQLNSSRTSQLNFYVKSAFHIVADPVTKNHFLTPAHIDGKFLVFSYCTIQQCCRNTQITPVNDASLIQTTNDVTLQR